MGASRKAKKVPVKKGTGRYGMHEQTSHAKEPVATYTSRLRAIGNSKGVILNSQVIEIAGFSQDADIVIQANDGVIFIMQVKETGVNNDLSTWDKQFKAAIKKGAKPESDVFEGIANEFDSKEW